MNKSKTDTAEFSKCSEDLIKKAIQIILHKRIKIQKNTNNNSIQVNQDVSITI